LEDFGCPPPANFKPSFNSGIYCHKFPNVSCGTRNAHSFYNCLMYHLQTKFYVKFRKRRHVLSPCLFQLYKMPINRWRPGILPRDVGQKTQTAGISRHLQISRGTDQSGVRS
jgi:hypothetical protein